MCTSVRQCNKNLYPTSHVLLIYKNHTNLKNIMKRKFIKIKIKNESYG